jgi:hypothetical protein
MYSTSRKKRKVGCGDDDDLGNWVTVKKIFVF